MNYSQQLKQLNLKEPHYYKQWAALLRQEGIEGLPQAPVDVDGCLGIFEDQRLIATGAYQKNVLKYIAVDANYQGGKMFNDIISALINALTQQGIFHFFVFTKPIYRQSFEFVGFKLLAQTSLAVLLEAGDASLQQFIAQVPRIDNQSTATFSAIVMNANPFTLGHRYLVTQAAQKSDFVYVFVVSQDVSLFTTEERFTLVQQGLSDLPNVIVVPSSDYMVSYATFPAYFLPESQDVIEYQTALDAQLFKKIATQLNIQQRFLGEEPFSKTTALYNQALQVNLPPEVTVEVIPRLKIATQTISATQVRKAIQNGTIETIHTFVPETTYQFIKQNQAILQARIQKGMQVDGN
ncbi:[citrate (pro-3S)-lyase] ligase [Latilactobacillus sakei]